MSNSGQFQPTHGHSSGRSSDGRRIRSAEYIAWSAIFARCENVKSPKFVAYGARGIKICERWRKFENFLADMGSKPSPKHSLDRYPDNDGDYEPGNCRWATSFEQMRNTRTTHKVEYQGRVMPVIEAAALAGLPYETVRKRLTRFGWAADRALSQPVRGSS